MYVLNVLHGRGRRGGGEEGGRVGVRERREWRRREVEEGGWRERREWRRREGEEGMEECMEEEEGGGSSAWM